MGDRRFETGRLGLTQNVTGTIVPPESETIITDIAVNADLAVSKLAVCISKRIHGRTHHDTSLTFCRFGKITESVKKRTPGQTGTAVISGDTARIIVSGSGLTPAQIAQINEIVYEQASITPVNITITEKA